MVSPPVVLTIAGSDSSAGAGIQADLKTIVANGCYGLTALTSIVAEVPGRVTSIQAVRTQIVRDQIRLAFEAFPVAAVKTGMLYSAAIVSAVCEVIREVFDESETQPPLVVDPVMVATSGDALLEPAAIRAYRSHLFPLATLLTPNLDELGMLTGAKPESITEMRKRGEELAKEAGCAVLCKGGHLQQEDAVDVLIQPNGCDFFSTRFIDGVSTHGTGCTYASAIASQLALGRALPEAVDRAKTFLTSAIKHSYRWGETQALNHQHLVRLLSKPHRDGPRSA